MRLATALALAGSVLLFVMVVALQPAILLLDEPTASLDVQATRDIKALLTRLARDYTLIVVSHSPAQAARLARHLVVLEEGRVQYQSPCPPVCEESAGQSAGYTEADVLGLMYGAA